MLQIQFPAILVVAVDHPNDRPPHVREVEQQRLFDLLKLATFDLVVARAFVEAELKQLVPPAEVVGEELVDERQIVVNPPHLENLFASLAGMRVPVLLLLVVVAGVVIVAEAAAIPAVIAYNLIIGSIREMASRIERTLRWISAEHSKCFCKAIKPNHRMD